ncbi:2Fe-2S iron-sulfur cluster-binding protein [Pseudomonas benzenivorans]|jgi:ferredoxin, 2Fe-2S|uniref:2Fe-2S iron-sulfur cluster binding domain-containing protein n=1 Tax=Pseudomonas benzenivorans TaxID=556533 RepID=A0ABY5H9X6_9PSED|nr:2Fe-2S iron-sulfur cluster-binding protein [Pseudomonas benzenivorans]UTW08194.1 2Fe-2S iron-sulfur cluster binding domain-containing protein [Pseudomonas benzenivorans]
MPRVTWKSSDGKTVSADIENGVSLMEAAVNLNVAGIFGDCGGALSCATCHVVVDEAWHDIVAGPTDMESEMLEVVEGGRTDRSRLSCQIRVTEQLDGIVLHVGA